MNRFHWYQIPVLNPDRIKTLGEFLLKHPFGLKNRTGFKIEEIRTSHIVGQFVERNEFTQTVEDPLGNKFDLKQIRFETVDFTIADDVPQLECRNAGRNIRDFRNEIAKALNYEIAITRITFDVAAFIKSLSKFASRVTLVKAVANDIRLADDITAQIHVTGDSDVRSSLKKFLKGTSHSLTRARIEAAFDNEEIALEVASTGLISFDASPSPKIVSLIRGTVRQCGK